MKPLFFGQLLIITLTTFLLATTALAHKVRVFAWQEGETIFTESKFSGGKPAKNVAVFVENPDTQKRLLTGHTDQAGNFSFKIPDPSPKTLVVVVDGGDGHRNSWTHSLEKVAAPQNKTVRPEKSTSKTSSQQSPVETNSITIDKEQLRTIIETVLDQKLSPVKKSLAEYTDPGPSVQDILGGIGYILGFAGIAAYFKSKKH